MTSYAHTRMAMDPDARAPDPGDALRNYAGSYVDDDYLGRTDPLTMLRLADNLRLALRQYEEECVYEARRAGATWEEVGEALGTARQNAHRKYGHLDPRCDDA